jgi:hypothetical protein
MEPQHNRTWWDRNWKWFVPLGCLGPLVLFAGFIALVVCLVCGTMKSSDAYKDAVSRARANPSVQKALGTPIEEGLFVQGSINISGLSGQADLAIPISGPNGNGTIHAVATKAADQWTFATLVVEIDGTGQRINLLD